uniref:Fibronectin type-III domain-containing protein n=1 Tax=Hippocampus comes TaxID=109280 RepID=A0A3Q2Y7X2_HIPCM
LPERQPSVWPEREARTAELQGLTLSSLLSDTPGPPINFRFEEVRKNSVILVWDAPEDDGGCEVDSYILEKCETRRMVWSTYSASVVTAYCNVTRLVEGNEYIFRVRAENKMGTGPAVESKPVTVRTQFNRPGPPDAPEVTKVGSEHSCGAEIKEMNSQTVQISFFYKWRGGKMEINTLDRCVKNLPKSQSRTSTPARCSGTLLRRTAAATSPTTSWRSAM